MFDLKFDVRTFVRSWALFRFLSGKLELGNFWVLELGNFWLLELGNFWLLELGNFWLLELGNFWLLDSQDCLSCNSLSVKGSKLL